MTDSGFDIQAMLRTLVEQQTAFLNAQAESMRLQRVLVERLLGVDAAPQLRAAQISALTPTPAPVPNSTPASPGLESRPTTHEGPSTQDGPSSVGEQPADPVADAPELHPIAEPASLTTPGGQAEERTGNGAAGRGERYYRAQQPTGTAQARPMSLEGLDVLRRIQATGDVSHLVLTFGPHAGETLGQIARNDPDYLRRLATTAQRPDVRAAAATLVDALPTLPSAHDRQWHGRGGRRRGAS